jgi:hypothetical protein
MIHVTDKDGHEYGGSDHHDVVRLMKLDSFVPDPTLRAYKQGVASRVSSWGGVPIQYTTAKEFLSELHRIGVVVLLEVPDAPAG